MIRVRRVPATQKWAGLLDYLQLACLPADEPCKYKADDLWWIAFDGDRPLGFAGIRPIPAAPDHWYLCRAGVLPSARGHGLQKRLIRARVAAARAARAAYVVTDTLNTNCASSNSLIAEGFRTYLPAGRWGHPNAIYWRKAL